MKVIAAILVLVVALAAGEWLYRTFWRPIDPLQPVVLDLVAYFNRSGLEVRPYAVRHGFRHSYMTAAAAVEIRGFPLPVAVDVAPSEMQAERQLANLKASRNLMEPHRNGRLVMYLPAWGDDSEVMAKRVTTLFEAYRSAE